MSNGIDYIQALTKHDKSIYKLEQSCNTQFGINLTVNTQINNLREFINKSNNRGNELTDQINQLQNIIEEMQDDYLTFKTQVVNKLTEFSNSLDSKIGRNELTSEELKKNYKDEILQEKEKMISAKEITQSVSKLENIKLEMN